MDAVGSVVGGKSLWIKGLVSFVPEFTGACAGIYGRGLRQNGVYIDCWLEFEKKYFFCGNRRNRRNAVISE